MDEYQSLAATTAVFPRVYTEHQVRAMFDEFNPYVAMDDSGHVDDLLDRFETEFNRLVYPVLGLVGEAGEIANKLKKVARDCEGQWGPEETADYEGELGDVQWYVAAIATSLKSKLGDIAAKNITKLFSRKARGVLGGSGDNR
jgi:NTP pyrophosphatase (non-canonical NTP hydrolase)